MKIQPRLKLIRVFVSLIFFLLISVIFLDIYRLIDVHVFKAILLLQFVPSLIEFLRLFNHALAGLLFVIILVLLFGRVYCSFLCPLGALQDIFTYISRKTGIRPRFKKFRKYNVLRYGILVLTAGSMIAGSMLLVNLLDPYSNYGRMAANLVKPVLVEVLNLAARVFIHYKQYWAHLVNSDISNLVAFVFPFAFLVIILVFSLFYGRQYCNTICPLGSLLGLLSKISVFKIGFNKEKCTICGSCSTVCKAGCIDLKNQEVDFSRCVACYNCIKVCPESGIKYRFSYNKQRQQFPQTDKSKRSFLSYGFSGLIAFISLGLKSDQDTNALPLGQLIPFKRNTPVTPPGSVRIKDFVKHCTACHLCVTACPSQVLQPAFLEYGLEGILQPTMDFESSFCNYECNVCSQVCPSGAILDVSVEQKKTIQIGFSRFIKQNCIVETKDKACGACSEHCPTKACQMVPYKNGLKIPEIKVDICVGCGACEYACPVIPDKAIIVDGNDIHLTAMKPEKKKWKKNPLNKEIFLFSTTIQFLYLRH